VILDRANVIQGTKLLLFGFGVDSENFFRDIVLKKEVQTFDQSLHLTKLPHLNLSQRSVLGKT
jgi:hypothetical protein